MSELFCAGKTQQSHLIDDSLPYANEKRITYLYKEDDYGVDTPATLGSLDRAA